MKIVLASGSPRRKELLKKITTDFEVIPSQSEEKCEITDPARYATQLARDKAKDVYALNPDALVIGCDTVVDLDGRILGKPKTPQHAKEMLRSLSGRTHSVHTGVCIIARETCSFCESTQVTFRKLTESEIETYVNGGGAMDKAGAYGIQECGFVESYVGSYDNVVGFPTERIKEIIEKYTG